jgi:hypothetical protein
LQRIEDRIVNVATHVAKGAGAEVEPLAPVARMVVTVADEWPLRRDAQPSVPVENGGHRRGIVGARVGVAPLFLTPGVDFFHLADGALLDDARGLLIPAIRCLFCLSHFHYQIASFYAEEANGKMRISADFRNVLVIRHLHSMLAP